MTSRYPYKQVKKNLAKAGLKKLDYNEVSFESIYLNYTERTDIDLDKIHIYSKIPSTWSSPYFELGEDEFINENDNYDFYIEFSAKTLKEFSKIYDFYMIKNESFGYDTQNLDVLDKRKNLKFPKNQWGHSRGPKQTLIFIEKKPKDETTTFFVFPSLYCSFVYGTWVAETMEFYKKLHNKLKEIFGWPIYNYLAIPQIVKSMNNHNQWTDSKYTVFKKYLKENNFLQIKVGDFYEQAENKNWDKYFAINKKILTWKSYNAFNNDDFMAHLTYYEDPIYGPTSIWNNSNIKDIKIYKLDNTELGIKHYEKNPWINSSIRELLNHKDSDYIYWLKKNILFTWVVKEPILIWDQRNYQKLFYKIILPIKLLGEYSQEELKIVLNKILKIVQDINDIFAK